MSKNDLFWEHLERAYADDDNRRFDAAKAAEARRREDRRMMVFVGVGIVLSVFATFYIAGVIIFSSMPLPDTGW